MFIKLFNIINLKDNNKSLKITKILKENKIINKEEYTYERRNIKNM